ncbi:hypothetical protein OICFNHDK_2519 [Methylobacterium bullatum]|uniref:Uncharacterized protein n=1 Tax=Methylobacterium bullatum TaxID=570505 RepID=A0AAV4Z7A8_9HYPH|nr:hypothetical protein OICFNHDK_2519 [Methylobacterium bullatum]
MSIVRVASRASMARATRKRRVSNIASVPAPAAKTVSRFREGVLPANP